MTSFNDITNPQLRAAVLAAVDMFMAEEEAAKPAKRSNWRGGPLKKPVGQPTAWRSMAHVHAQHMGARS